MPEAAEALGKSLVNFRRWVSAELVPAPYLVTTDRGHLCYSAGELRLIADVLAAHETEFAYLCSRHETTIHELHQRMQAWRSHSI